MDQPVTAKKPAVGRLGSPIWPTRDPDAKQDYGPLVIENGGSSFVYFVGWGTDTIRIGFSKDPDWKRIKTHVKMLQHYAGGDLDILAVARATRQVETSIHRYFRFCNIQGQPSLFRADERLLDYIVWLRDQTFISTSEAEFDSGPGRTVVDPSSWLPHDTRRESRRMPANLFNGDVPWHRFPSRIMTGDDWFTHPTIMGIARKAFGGNIDLDPASHVIANEIVKAAKFFTLDQDGLLESWRARNVWMNPPFSDYGSFAAKALKEIVNGNIEQFIGLGPTRALSAVYMRDFLARADAFSIMTGRLPFWGMQVEVSAPVDGWFFVYMGPCPDRFVGAFSEVGVAFLRSSSGAIQSGTATRGTT